MNDEMNQMQDPALEFPSDVEPQPAEPTAPPMQVIPADEFFDRLAELLGKGDSDPEEVGEAEESEEMEEVELVDGEVDLPAVDPTTAVVE